MVFLSFFVSSVYEPGTTFVVVTGVVTGVVTVVVTVPPLGCGCGLVPGVPKRRDETGLSGPPEAGPAEAEAGPAREIRGWLAEAEAEAEA